jgi:hypothetical protein
MLVAMLAVVSAEALQHAQHRAPNAVSPVADINGMYDPINPVGRRLMIVDDQLGQLDSYVSSLWHRIDELQTRADKCEQQDPGGWVEPMGHHPQRERPE